MEPGEYTLLFEQEETYWWYRGLRQLALEQVRAAAGPTRPRMLDAGCGTGGMLARLAPLGLAVGLDASPLALAHAARRGAAPLCRGTVGALPFRSGAFDLIVSLDVLYHRDVASDLEALREFRRCLAPAGKLLLNLPAYERLRSSHDAAVHTSRRYRRRALRELLRQAGLDPLRLTYWNTLLFPALALLRLSRRGPGRTGGLHSDITPLPRALGWTLEQVLSLERCWLRHRDLPFGLSLLAVAQRPPTAG